MCVFFFILSSPSIRSFTKKKQHSHSLSVGFSLKSLPGGVYFLDILSLTRGLAKGWGRVGTATEISVSLPPPTRPPCEITLTEAHFLFNLPCLFPVASMPPCVGFLIWVRVERICSYRGSVPIGTESRQYRAMDHLATCLSRQLRDIICVRSINQSMFSCVCRVLCYFALRIELDLLDGVVAFHVFNYACFFAETHKSSRMSAASISLGVYKAN